VRLLAIFLLAFEVPDMSNLYSCCIGQKLSSFQNDRGRSGDSCSSIQGPRHFLSFSAKPTVSLPREQKEMAWPWHTDRQQESSEALMETRPRGEARRLIIDT
jgi:hypothetical protein